MNSDKMKEKYRKEHFAVPDGYFENFTEQMMAKLPEQPFQSMAVRRRSLLPQFAAAAAVAVVMISGAALYFSKNAASSYDDNSAAVSTDMLDDNQGYSMEEAAHYAMMDNQAVHYMVVDQ